MTRFKNSFVLLRSVYASDNSRQILRFQILISFLNLEAILDMTAEHSIAKYKGKTSNKN